MISLLKNFFNSSLYHTDHECPVKNAETLLNMIILRYSLAIEGGGHRIQN